MKSAGFSPAAQSDSLGTEQPGARSFSGRYRLWLCDVWGVVHNGVEANPEACEALERHRAQGGLVMLITNAPRPSRIIYGHLDSLGVSRDAYDGVVSSGDVTMELIANTPGKVFHLGPPRDHGLSEGAEDRFGAPGEAKIVLCTGLVNDAIETPREYIPQLRELRDRGVAMICANPDKVVRRGDTLIPCAGALADLYESMGGETIMAGKPHAPIYSTAIERASTLAGRAILRDEILAIGDGLSTDAEGALRNNLDLLFIVDGIHEAEFAGLGGASLAARIREAVPGVRLQGVMRTLRW